MMTVELISNHYDETFGLPRYNLTLIEYLKIIGFPYILNAPTIPNSIILINRFTQRLGYDIKSAYINYPFFISTNDSNLFHLTNHTLSTLLFMNRLENTIVTVHDIESEWEHFSRSYRSKRYVIYRALHYLSLLGLKKSDYLITDTEHVRKLLNLKLNFDISKIFVIPLGVDHRNFNVSSHRYKVITKASSQGSIILHVGTFAPRKNFENLVRAFAALIKDFPSARLVKVGNPNWPMEYEKVISLVHELNLEDRLIFLRGLTDFELAGLYCTADLVVYPSFYEGFGLPVLEAMACGTPVITSKTSCLPEVAGEAALLVDPNSVDEIAAAMRRVLEDPDLAQELRQKGLERARQFTWENTARATIAVYEKVLGEKLL